MAASTLPSRALGWLAAAATGALTFLAYPGWNYHFLAWFCLVPVLVAARNATVGGAVRLGLLGGLVTNAGGFWWMTEMLNQFGHLPMLVCWAILLLQATTQGLSLAVGMGAWRWLANRSGRPFLAAFAGIWLGEALVPMIFPWFFGNALSPELRMIQIAELGGVSLVSALVIAANVALAETVSALLGGKRPPLGGLAATVIAVAATWLYGGWRIDEVDREMAAAPKIKIGLVEGNVGIWEKEARYLEPRDRLLTRRHNLLKHQWLSADLQQQGAELIVWPESAYMPIGPMPVKHALDDALVVGAGGAIARITGDRVQVEAADRLGLPRDLGMLTGLSAPRGDLWRAIDRGNRIVTVGPKGSHAVTLPDGNVAVATVALPPEWTGKVRDGFVVARTGRMWKLPFPSDGPTVGQPPPLLAELPVHVPDGLDLTSAAADESERMFAVGRRGAIVQFTESTLATRQSPTSQDIWQLAAEPLGRNWVAAAGGGAVLTLDEDGDWRATAVGQGNWYAAWACMGGDRYVGGERGQVAMLPAGWSRWSMLPPLAADVLAGACDGEGGAIVLARGGAIYRGDAKHGWRAVANPPRGELTAVAGLLPHPALALPRTAKAIVPSRQPLPVLRAYPTAAMSDDAVPELDRSTPQRGFSAPLLLGALSHGSPLSTGEDGHCDDCYNSAALLSPTGEIVGMTDKAFLLAFGEYMPFGEMFPWLYTLSPETSHFQHGTKTAPIEYEFAGNRRARMGMLICYEDLLPRQAQKIAAHNPNVFINLTNDAWFGQTAEPEHHLNLALLRTVEYRRWLVRSTNTGISVFIDAAGRRVAETKLTDAETLLREVPLLETRTLYSRLGDWPYGILALLVLLLAFWPAAAQAKPKKGKRSAG